MSRVGPRIVDAVPAAPPRPVDAHKGTFGTVIVIGGCPTMPGAPALTARAALRSGAGLVKIAADAKTLALALPMCASVTGIEMTGEPLADGERLDAADPHRRAVLAVGPGWGPDRTPDTNRSVFLRAVLTDDRPVVLDADGLNTLAIAIRKDANFLDSETCSGPRVFTPHPAEFQRLAEAFSQSQHLQDDPTAAEDRPRLAAWLARVCRSAVVLKGKNTVVSDAAGSTHFVNQTGNPALATAGTGDVLTGLIAGLMAQGMPAFDAACLGVHIHGVAADAWSQNNGPGGLLAEELADQLPTAIHALRRN